MPTWINHKGEVMYYNDETTVLPPDHEDKVRTVAEMYVQAKAKESLRPGDSLEKQGVKFDNGKARLELVPPEGVLGVSEILSIGAKKYAARNWEKGMEWSRPYAAAQRHLYAWWSGENRDPDTGKSHLWHAACNLFFLIAYEARATGTDDRPSSNTPRLG